MPTAGLPLHWQDFFEKTDKTFASLLAVFIGAKEVQIEGSGAACLLIALETLKKRSRRRTVIIPAYTCPLVVLAAAQAGLKVIACDLAANSFELDHAHLAKLLGPDTLCVIATHYGGALTDAAGLKKFIATSSPDTYVIEDAAQAFGATWNGKHVGLAAHIGFFSFAIGKGLTLYKGGALVCEDEKLRVELAETSQRLVRHSYIAELRCSVFFALMHFFYNPLGAALTYGLSRRYWLMRGNKVRAVGDYFAGDIPLYKVGGWRQKMGALALRRLPDHLRTVQENSIRLGAKLSNLPGLKVYIPPSEAKPTNTFIFVTLPSADVTQRALRKLWRSSLGVSKLFAHAINDYSYLSGKILPSDTPNAHFLAERTITITTAPSLTAHDAEKILECIRASYA
jgi:dTDP-4-amino-4,6-dideoxygalactose transaminase